MDFNKILYFCKRIEVTLSKTYEKNKTYEKKKKRYV